jgi:hypothetical protein
LGSVPVNGGGIAAEEFDGDRVAGGGTRTVPPEVVEELEAAELGTGPRIELWPPVMAAEVEGIGRPD